MPETQPSRPAITKAQIIAILVAGVPVLSNLLSAFGVFAPSPAEQHALTEALKWAVGFGAFLVSADSALRAARNHADGKAKLAAAINEHSVALMRPPQQGESGYATVSKVGGTISNVEVNDKAMTISEVRGSFESLPPNAADNDGPGDLFDPLPHIPAADPSKIKPDEVDRSSGPESETFGVTRPQPHHDAIYHWSDQERREGRRIMLAGIENLLANASAVHYTQDYAERWSAIHDHDWIWHGGFLRKGDCSSTTTWLLLNAFRFCHHRDDTVNRQRWLAGYTGTQINHGRVVHHDANLRFGDLIFYGNQGGGVPEHVAMYIGGGMVFSHGSEGGPYKLALDYRPDRVAARRYF